MSWSEVATILILVSGAVTAASIKQEHLAMALAGAAAGFASRSTTSRPLSTRRKGPEGGKS